METLKHKENLSILNKPVSRTIALFEVLPLTLKIYDEYRLLQETQANEVKIDAIDFESSFAENLSTVFGIQGELEGFAICQTKQALTADVFVEVMNIWLGQFLTNLDNKHNLFANLTAPLIFYPNLKPDEQFYKFNNRLISFMRESKVFTTNYLLQKGERLTPITITLVTKFKGEDYGRNNI